MERECSKSVLTVWGRFFLCLSVAVLCFSSPQSLRADEGTVLCLPDWTGLVDVRAGTCVTKEDLTRMMALPVDVRGASPLRLSHPTDLAKSEEVSSCNDYMSRKDEGWYALTQRDMSKEVWFIRTCGTLLALNRAQKPRSSFLNTQSLASDLSILPSTLLVTIIEEQKPAANTVSALVSEKKCQVIGSEAKELNLLYAEIRTQITELARADFDGDGIEDIFLNITGKPDQGTAVVAKNILLTRHQGRGVYRMKEIETLAR